MNRMMVYGVALPDAQHLCVVNGWGASRWAMQNTVAEL